jgi:hypothetical protein
MSLYKLQVQEDEAKPDHWHDVLGEDDKPRLFTKEADARAVLTALFPVLVKMEQLGVDRKRTRVIVVSPYDDIDNPKDE